MHICIVLYVYIYIEEIKRAHSDSLTRNWTMAPWKLSSTGGAVHFQVMRSLGEFKPTSDGLQPTSDGRIWHCEECAARGQLEYCATPLVGMINIMTTSLACSSTYFLILQISFHWPNFAFRGCFVVI